jgi:hypothetical protein
MRRIDAAVDNGYLNPFAGTVGGQPVNCQGWINDP